MLIHEVAERLRACSNPRSDCKFAEVHLECLESSYLVVSSLSLSVVISTQPMNIALALLILGEAPPPVFPLCRHFYFIKAIKQPCSLFLYGDSLHLQL